MKQLLKMIVVVVNLDVVRRWWMSASEHTFPGKWPGNQEDEEEVVVKYVKVKMARGWR